MKSAVLLNRWASAKLSYARLSSAVAFRIGTIIFTVMETPSPQSARREQLLCEFPRVPRERRSRQTQEV